MAEVFEWGEGTVVKLYRPEVPRERVHHEHKATQLAGAAGLPVPAVHDIVEHEGRVGIVFERITGTSLLQRLEDKPWTLRGGARLLAGLQQEVNDRSGEGLPARRDELRTEIAASGLPADVIATLHVRLAGMPDGDRLVHGDFHPDNVILTRSGPVIIDWADATCGDPLVDVVRTRLLLELGEIPAAGTRRRVVAVGRSLFAATYMSRVRRLRQPSVDQLDAWAPFAAAGRLAEKISSERDELLTIVHRGLQESTRRHAH